ncbi:MAG: hypothetical protein HGA90_00585 [Alphaproteobacteria bacterium]|nr:hypothetical protein [Alphaproteobacteria bacterium]
MSFLPPQALSRLLEALVRRMEERHPRLFRNLARLDKAIVHIEPQDLPHRFALSVGAGTPTLKLIPEGGRGEKPRACIRGNLDVLLDMLEGRTDGDTEFFSRSITVMGDTSTIVALRNTLDREEINLWDEFMDLCGPFAQPVGLAVTILDGLARAARLRLQTLHAELHETELTPSSNRRKKSATLKI